MNDENREADKSDADRYRLALESLTPGGSEFYKNPAGCVAHVRARFDSGHKAKKEVVRLRRSLDIFIRDMNGDGSWFKCGACGETWKAEREHHDGDCPVRFRSGKRKERAMKQYEATVNFAFGIDAESEEEALKKAEDRAEQMRSQFSLFEVSFQVDCAEILSEDED